MAKMTNPGTWTLVKAINDATSLLAAQSREFAGTVYNAIQILPCGILNTPNDTNGSWVRVSWKWIDGIAHVQVAGDKKEP